MMQNQWFVNWDKNPLGANWFTKIRHISKSYTFVTLPQVIWTKFIDVKRIQGNTLIKGTVEQRRSPRVSQMSPDKEKVINESYAINECDLLLYCYNESPKGKGLQTSRKRHWPIAKQVCNSRDHAEICCKLCQLNCKSAKPQDCSRDCCGQPARLAITSVVLGKRHQSEYQHWKKPDVLKTKKILSCLAGDRLPESRQLYRLISILSIQSKVLERHVHTSFYEFRWQQTQSSEYPLVSIPFLSLTMQLWL